MQSQTKVTKPWNNRSVAQKLTVNNNPSAPIQLLLSPHQYVIVVINVKDKFLYVCIQVGPIMELSWLNYRVILLSVKYITYFHTIVTEPLYCNRHYPGISGFYENYHACNTTGVAFSAGIVLARCNYHNMHACGHYKSCTEMLGCHPSSKQQVAR